MCERFFKNCKTSILTYLDIFKNKNVHHKKKTYSGLKGFSSVIACDDANDDLEIPRLPVEHPVCRTTLSESVSTAVIEQEKRLYGVTMISKYVSKYRYTKVRVSAF